MKYIVLILIATCLAACETPTTRTVSSPATTGKPVTFGGGNGSSFATAIIVHASDEVSGVHSEYDYIKAHYPGYHFISQALTSHGSKAYDIMQFTSADGKKRMLYFDITNYFGKGFGS